MILSKKIDFLCIVVAENCNPNGDPLMSNRPRCNYDGYGEMSQECIKRKIRNRLQDMGERIFVQSDDRCDDGCDSLRARADKCEALKKVSSGKNTNRDEYSRIACAEWIDVRSFGQVFAFKGVSSSIGVRGPVSLTIATTIEPVFIKDYLITKSTNTVSETKKDSATMGNRYCIDKGVYIFKGGIYPQLAEKTGFTEEDAEKIKQALLTLFENDASASRPNGSMSVAALYWWVSKGKISHYAPIKIFNSVKINPIDKFPYYKTTLNTLDGITPEVYELL